MKTRLYLLSVFLLCVVSLCIAALPASDAMTDTNGTPLTTHSASWTINNGGFTINASNAASGNSSVNNMAHWNADAFSDDQYSEVVIASILSTRYPGAAVRVDASANTGYFCFENTTTLYLRKIIAGSETQLSSIAVTGANGDTIRLEVSGTSLSCYQNSVLKLGPTSDSAIASGSSGIAVFSSGSIDSWEGGNLSSTDDLMVIQ